MHRRPDLNVYGEPIQRLPYRLIGKDAGRGALGNMARHIAFSA